MYEKLTIESLDNFGRGVTHYNDLVIFVVNALPNEVVDIKITQRKKHYQEGIVIKYHSLSPLRKESICPYFLKCGGCNLLFYDYENTLEFKITKVKNLLTQNKINYSSNLKIIRNPHPLNYRDKISLKIINNKIGFYESKTHDLISINECLMAKEPINTVIANYQLLNITNGELIIRTNNNSEVLLIINSKDKCNVDIIKLKELVKLIGIVYNDKLIYGTDFYYERLNNFLFKVSYDSFFQVNPYITSELFKLVSENITLDSVVLDLYSGVGTLSLVASLKAKHVYSVEIIKNAVLNGLQNAKLNHKDNIDFLLGDVAKVTSKLNLNFDTLIIDPPRRGLDKKTLAFIMAKKPSKILYISCDVNTLIRDLKVLEELYDLKDYHILDMFSYTYHLESFCVLEKK